MESEKANRCPEITSGHAEYRADLVHYWARLMWYRDELWRITTPVWGVYGAFIASCVGYVWSAEKSRIVGEVAGMLIVVIISFSWVIQRMYWTYAHRVYEAINQLNGEIQRREQFIYREILHQAWTANYGRYRVYPELNVIFSIVGIAMMFACIFTVAAAVGFDFSGKIPGGSDGADSVFFRVVQLCFVLLVVFEMLLMKFKKHCEICGQPLEKLQ